MPHSSGGGSHGGGSHGGSHGGSSGPRVSTHYFAGARRYRRHHISTGKDEYVYASSKPQKAGLGSVIFMSVFSAIFLGGTCFGVFSSVPHKLKTKYLDTPAVYDNVDVIADDESLVDTLKDYQELTGICPVIYTAVHEDWKDDYDSLEDYSFYTYTSNFKDEAHFVIVYSVPVSDLEYIGQEPGFVPDFKWEATQGDDTDPIITESYFKKFADKVQDGLESGEDAGVAFDEAFKFAYKKAENQLDPGSASRMLSIIGSSVPVLIVAGFLGVFLFFSIRQYRRDKDVEYDEVPLDVEPQTPVAGSNYHSKEVSYDLSKGGPVPKGAIILTLAITIPFTLIGITLIGAGIGIASNADRSSGVFMIGFGILWTAITLFTLIKMIAAFAKAKKNTDGAPSAPADTMPQTQPAPSQEQPQFDPQFFNNSQSNIENDDEDYKRMKRQGFE